MPHPIGPVPVPLDRKTGLLMGGLFEFMPLPRYFRQLGERGQVVMCQLPLSLTLVLVIALTAGFSPSTMHDGMFAATVGANAVLLALCALIPWEKLPDGSFAVIPALDCIALGFSREADPGVLSVLGLLAVFPVIWLSISRSWGLVIVAVLTAALSAVWPPMAVGTTLGAPTLIRMVLFPVIMTAVAITAHLSALGLRQQRLTLERKDLELEGLLSESRRQRLAELDVAAKLKRSDERFRLTFEHAPIGVALVSLQPETAGHILRANPAFCTLLGREAQEVTGSSILRFTALEDKPVAEGRLAQALFGAVSQYAESRRLVHADGHTVWTSMTSAVVTDDAGVPSYLVAQFQDITARREAEGLLERQALHDGLTGLPNRLLLMDRISHALARAHRQGTRVALFFLDVDRFKTVNDTFGHTAGDVLLTEVSRRLAQASRDDDTVARLGGDEFVVLCEDLPDLQAAELLARRLLKGLSTPQEIHGESLAVSTSLGIALSGDRITPDELLRDADTAMYQAKAAGGGRYEVYNEAMRDDFEYGLRTEKELRRALEDDQLRLVFQPVVSLAEDRLAGVEALVRWEHPTRGNLAPADFLGIAERSGLIVGIGQWMMRQACAELARWQRSNPETAPATVSVNLSPLELAQPHLISTIEDALLRAGLPPQALCVEITESALLDTSSTNLATVGQLRSLGVEIALDDFGTGYSSLTHLKSFPVNVIKIDRSFVAGLGTDTEDTAIVRAVINLAGALGLTTVAEGVENRTQRDHLKSLGCTCAQGYFYSRPLPARDLIKAVEKPHILPETSLLDQAIPARNAENQITADLDGRAHTP